MSDAPLPSAELRARVLGAARAESAAPRSIWLRRSALALAVAVAASLLMLVAIGGPSSDGRPVPYYVTLLALWAAIGGAATWVGVSRGQSMLGRPAGWRLSVAVLTPVALVATALLAGAAWPSTLEGLSDFHHHIVCIGCTLAMAAGPLVAFVLMRRASDPVAPRLTGAALGAAAGAWGASCIELRCGLATVDHVIFGHVLPVAVLTAVGIAVGARWVAVRSTATDG